VSGTLLSDNYSPNLLFFFFDFKKVMSLSCLPKELVVHVVCLYLEGADRAKLADLGFVPFSADSVSWEDALVAGSLKVLQRLNAIGSVAWSSHFCQRAASFGHLEVLKWAHSQRCPWNGLTCAFAAENGHLEMLKWARSQGCPWDERTCTFAARTDTSRHSNGHALKTVRGTNGHVFMPLKTDISKLSVGQVDM
jgi:hypothetical protein